MISNMNIMPAIRHVLEMQEKFEHVVVRLERTGATRREIRFAVSVLLRNTAYSFEQVLEIVERDWLEFVMEGNADA